MANIHILVLEEPRSRVEVEVEGGKSIVALAESEVLLHCDQPGRALAPYVMREGRWKEQRNIGDIVIGGGGRNEAKLWLVHLLKLTKLRKLTTEDSALFDGIGWEFVRIMLCNEFTKFLSSGAS